jgi:16S rRNA (guanine966-N2)-methyltransferase
MRIVRRLHASDDDILIAMLKIIGGEYRSRQLATPPDEAVTRPYSQRVKESVFNLLRGWFDDANVLDLFAGVGTIGLEAVSRGAKQVLMVEQDRKIFGLLQKNIETLGCGDRAIAMQGDALGQTALLRAPRPVDVVFIDPPYAIMQPPEGRARVLEQARRVRDVMAEQGFLVLRSPVRPEGPEWTIEGFDGPEEHRHGKDMWVLLYSPVARGATAPTL